jgi:hypothetical protein
MIYLQIVVTVILLTQLTRTIQNGISLYWQNKTFKDACGQLSDVTPEDMENQRKAYRMMVAHYEREEKNLKGGNK